MIGINGFGRIGRLVLRTKEIKEKIEEEIESINSDLKQVTSAEEIKPEFIIKIIELENIRKEMKKLLRLFRKLIIIKTRIAIIRAKSFIKRLFETLAEFSKKAIAIYGMYKLIMEVAEKIMKLMNINRSRKALFVLIRITPACAGSIKYTFFNCPMLK